MRGRATLALFRSISLIVIAFGIAAAIYEVSGYSAPSVFSGAVQGAITAPGAFTQTLRWTIPLLLTGIGVLVSFKAGFFNVGAQGQLYAGALCSYAVARTLAGISAPVVIALAIAAGTLGGTIWALIPGVLRLRFRTDEVLGTLMMSFIGILLLQWVTIGPYKNGSGTGEAASTDPISQAYRITGSSGVSASILGLTIAAVVVVWVVMQRTRFGLESALAGRNPLMARWQGVNLQRIGLTAFGISGATAGFAGALELLGPAGQLNAGFSPQLGFASVVVALVGVLTIPGVILASLFFGGLSSAVLFLPITTGLPQSALDLLQGIVATLITVTAWPRLAALRRGRRRAVTADLTEVVPERSRAAGV